ncbi:MAG TPA: VWA domain-containing protein [Polyangium sp.]|nr:VWA domain-containing protein [Polyangium sp.]
MGVAAIAAPNLAYADGALRTVLVIDASSSMRATDPKELRKVAAELFVDLTRDGDQLAVVGFDGAPRNAMPALVPIRSPADRDAVKHAIRAVGNDGNWTDFTAGFEGARAILAATKPGPGDQDLVVFLTDGRCDPDPKGPIVEAAKAFGGGKSKIEEVCQERVFTEQVSALGKSRIYAVGLSRSAPKVFLEELGRRTGGVGVATDRADELPRLFADIYARLFGGRLVEGPVVPTTSVAVDEGAASISVVLVGPPQLDMRLFDAAGTELDKNNTQPESIFFASSPAYRLFRINKPQIGSYRLDVEGPAKGARYAVLQNFDLGLDLQGLPELVEVGKPFPLTLRLATPGGKVAAAAFASRHSFVLAKVEGVEICDDAALAHATPVEMKVRADGTYEATIKPTVKGALCFIEKMAPGESGVLTREVHSRLVHVVPPIHLKAAVQKSFGQVKQEQSAEAIISLEGSEVGELMHAGLEITGLGDGMSFSHRDFEIAPGGPRTFKVTLGVGRDSPAGARDIGLRIVPQKPAGFEDRAVSVTIAVTVVPLSFWERYGRKVEIGLIALFTVFLLFGIVLPARFRRTAMLHYEDRRDPDLPREGKFPLGVKARAGLYRSAKMMLGPAGPVQRAGMVELRAGPGGGVLAQPLGGRKAKELPRDASIEGAEPRDVKLVKGWFRVSPGVKYEIDGTGLVFFWTQR